MRKKTHVSWEAVSESRSPHQTPPRSQRQTVEEGRKQKPRHSFYFNYCC